MHVQTHFLNWIISELGTQWPGPWATIICSTQTGLNHWLKQKVFAQSRKCKILKPVLCSYSATPRFTNSTWNQTVLVASGHNRLWWGFLVTLSTFLPVFHCSFGLLVYLWWKSEHPNRSSTSHCFRPILWSQTCRLLPQSHRDGLHFSTKKQSYGHR